MAMVCSFIALTTNTIPPQYSPLIARRGGGAGPWGPQQSAKPRTAQSKLQTQEGGRVALLASPILLESS